MKARYHLMCEMFNIFILMLLNSSLSHASPHHLTRHPDAPYCWDCDGPPSIYTSYFVGRSNFPGAHHESFPMLQPDLALEDILGSYPVNIDFLEMPPKLCSLPSGEIGTCVSIKHCPEVVRRFRDGVHPEKPVHCGFSWMTPIVCCPEADYNDFAGRVHHPVIHGIRGKNKPRMPILPQPEYECGITSPVYRSGHHHHNPHHRHSRYVVGGKETAIGKYPWMGILGKVGSDGKPQWMCDAALIHPLWVASAAHCVLEKASFIVRLGEHNISSDNEGATPIDIKIANISFHPDFKVGLGYHDLVLLKLAKPATVQRFIRPVCLPTNELNPLVDLGEMATLAGWGAERFGGNLSSVLRDAFVTVFNVSICDKSYSQLADYKTLWPEGINEKYIICAGGVNGGIDSCQGDSGGPLVRKINNKFTLIGIVSRGYGCGIKDFPGIYVKVRVYLNWIKEQMAQP